MARSSEYADGFSVAHFLLQFVLIGAVFYLWSSPIIQPLKVMVVLFHEMSHGLVALLSGGKVVSILVTADEGGACESEGGITLLIVGAGYLGSMFFGGLLLYLSRIRGCVGAIYILLTLVLSAAIFTVFRDAYTRRFATVLAGSFIVLGLLAPHVVGALLLRILGTVSCLYVIFDIYWDILARDRPGYVPENDAVAFAKLSGLSPQVVGLLWLGVAVVYFLVILKAIVTSGGGPPEPQVAGAAAT